MKKKILFIVLALGALMQIPLGAQTHKFQEAFDLLKADPSRASGLHHSYEVPAIHDTKAPKGYTPFYVSHYGRHGSRYHTSDTYYKRVMPILDSLEALHLLTPAGQELRRDIAALDAAQKGLDGILTQKGSLEHQGIAQRLYDRVPEVFKQKDREAIMAASTPVQRCIQSMANFASSLKGNAPQLKISLYTGDKYYDYLCKSVNSSAYSRRNAAIKDSLIRAYIHPERLMKVFFTDPAEASKHLGKYDDATFIDAVFYAANIEQCFDEAPVDALHEFNIEEIYDVWCVENANSFESYIESVENEGVKIPVGQAILKDMVDKADEAIAGNNKCADLRFGHDSGLGPLLSLLKVKGYDKVMKEADSDGYWYAFKYLCMGSNLQMIFYRSKKNPEILVKLLRNEEETTIPSLPTVDGVYYKWSDLRAYFETLLAR